MKTIVWAAASLVLCGISHAQDPQKIGNGNGCTTVQSYHDSPIIIQDGSVEINFTDALIAVKPATPYAADFVIHTHAQDLQINNQGKASCGGAPGTDSDNQVHTIGIYQALHGNLPVFRALQDCDQIQVTVQLYVGSKAQGPPSYINIQMKYAPMSIYPPHVHPNACPPLPANEFSRVQGWYVTTQNITFNAASTSIYRTPVRQTYRLQALAKNGEEITKFGDGCGALMISTVAGAGTEMANHAFPPAIPNCPPRPIPGPNSFGKE